MVTMWITTDGQFKVEAIHTSDKGQYITVKRWDGEGWILVRPQPDIRIPLSLSFEKAQSFMIRELRNRGVDPNDLIECDPPDWPDSCSYQARDNDFS